MPIMPEGNRSTSNRTSNSADDNIGVTTYRQDRGKNATLLFKQPLFTLLLAEIFLLLHAAKIPIAACLVGRWYWCVAPPTPPLGNKQFLFIYKLTVPTYLPPFRGVQPVLHRHGAEPHRYWCSERGGFLSHQ